jgi:outer membrane protein
LAVLRDQELVDLEQTDVKQLSVIKETALKRLGLGELTKTDTSQAEARFLGAQINLTNARNQLAASQASFQHYVGQRPESLDSKVELPALPGNEALAFDIAEVRNPSVQQARFAAKAADSAVDAANGALLPSLSVQAQYARSNAVFGSDIVTNTASVMGQVSVPLYQGGAEYAEIRQAKEQRSQAELEISEASRQAQENVDNAWQSLLTSTASYDLSQSQARSNATAYEGSKLESQVGSRTTLDILNADEELLQSKVQVVTASYNVKIAALQLLSSIGQMTAKALNLPAPYYDPREHYREDATRWLGFGGD